ncbi:MULTISPECIES: hypothetical protein [Rhodococcus]|uniref:hypothetical protein n=1 Tax=Rhodococcus TaxID=1827 RepID=UPI002954A314|nr:MULTISPECIES: hypothetical protein [Rhodococcus]MDV7244459.1 hypothetical protein [Rhodococcus oxybenzonivorans]MDV7274298.1 hypothetical protein [Rhodococcus oxybenzonivorans]MDV7337816.1 hypothetical protein [Rhodococcus oxybenzonivorans]MDV7345248.1 hypothetical protein [Rhodococcus oxybenzonivorans]MDV8028936.1 hypothetical protein [Rhodococcus sp. IEGM 27]
MNTYIADRGIQATAASAVALGVLTVTNYSTPMLAMWAIWAGIGAWAISNARRRNAAA